MTPTLPLPKKNRTSPNHGISSAIETRAILSPSETRSPPKTTNTPTHKRKSNQQPENTPHPNAETKNQSH